MGPTLRYAGMLLAIILALVAQTLVIYPERAAMGWVLFAVSAAVAVLVAPPPEEMPLAEAAVAPAPTRMLSLRIALGALAVTAIGATVWLSQANQRPVLAAVLWLAGIAVGSLALIGTTVSTPRRARVAWSRREIAAFIVVCAMALLARTIWLDDVPRYYFDDESRVGLYLYHVFNGDNLPGLFAMGWNSWPIVGMALQGMFAPLLGLDTFSLRLSSAVSGTLAVAFAYLLARALLMPRLAVLTAILFACSRTAIDFSRMGICHAQVMVFETLAFWSLWRAINTGSGLSYLWTGIGLALCLYTYNAGQLVPLLWLGWVVLALLRAPRLTLRAWRGGVLTVAGLVLTILPFLLYVTDNFRFATHWQEYTGMARNRQVVGRMAEAWTTIGPAEALRILGEQAERTWLGFNVLPADAYQLGYRGGGMLDHVSAALFVLGLALCIVRGWRPRYAFLLYWWLLTTAAGGVITQAPPAYVRMVGILPVLAVFGALPLDALWRIRLSGESRNDGVAKVTGTIIALLGIAMVVDGFRTYFVAFPRDSSQPSSELVRYVRTTPPDTTVLLIGAEHHLEVSTEIYKLDLPLHRFENVGEPSQILPLREMPDKPVALIFGDTQTTLAAYAHTLYPAAMLTDVPQPGQPAELVFRAALIRGEDIAARQGLAVTADGARAVTADPFASSSPAANCRTRTWTGGIYWPIDQAVHVHAEAPPTTRVTLAGRSLSGNDDTAQLPRGWNRIAIDEQCAGARQFSLSIEWPGHGQTFTRRDVRPDYAGEGLLATYLRNETPVLHMIDGNINAFAVEELLRVPYDVPLRMPFTATWSGSLQADVTGQYLFEAVFSGPMLLTLDGEPLMQETVKIPEEPRTARITRTLTAGSHALFALWDSTRRAHTSRRIFQLYWTPPHGERALIAPTSFRPAQSDTGTQALPTISIPPTPTPIALGSGPRRPLTDASPIDIKFGFAAPHFDKSWNGSPIVMHGIEYRRGIGAHAWARLTYAVPADAVELQAIVGLADDAQDCARATVRFEVRNENDTLLYDSGVVDVYTPPKLAKVPLAGSKTITLVVDDAGDGIDCDHANWAEPSFMLR